jgi:hypothetical protein
VTRLFRFSCLFLILCAGILRPGYARATMQEQDPVQLELFHWWNACPEDQPFGPHAAASRLPVHEGGFVWGRSGHQWVQSVISYLAWRQGSAWRPETHRFHPVRWHFNECIAVVQQAYFGNVKWWAASAPHVERCPVCLSRSRQILREAAA